MFNFDRDRYKRIQGGAVACRDSINQAIEEITARGFTNLFLIGSGGAGILMSPAEYVLRTHSTLPVYREIAAEFVTMDHKHLNERSLVVLASLSGTTQETVEAAQYCKDRGAVTISFTGKAGTPLAGLTDYSIVNFAEDDTSCESFFIQFYLLAFRIMYNRGEFPDYDRLVAEWERLPEALLDVKERTEERAKAFAERYRNEDYHMMVGSGNTWGEAYYYAMCILEEMQWIKTRPVHASDFFHGALELIEKDMSLILLKGEDETRPLMDRVERFAKSYTDELTVFDTADYELAGISPAYRKYVSPIVAAALLERVSCHLEHVRNHPLTTRRYYRRVQY
ncbi:SIS domain-containing protein [Paenibacillus ehimensis]|uniref:SIS domain-containing protein n=1 Tax=Paenibacillus ehimensis TaxID=79264 RepID=UPI002DB926CB|nr:SIS domain-containing protein [Paenibacillus ehimensis]MEC0207802.1 SIS domain-containing protein [Paenibacillus ehimensis]